MVPEKFEKLAERAGGDMASQMNVLREKAEHFIAERIEEMKEQGEAVSLGDDELRLLTAYRAFKARSPVGSVFAWRTPNEPGIVLPQEPSLIVDPREVVI